uniref:Ribosomal protein n=2 Tax=Auxenochlorella protothecoides TaxID=3075 RepID=A0A1D2AF59_AUXPR
MLRQSRGALCRGARHMQAFATDAADPLASTSGAGPSAEATPPPQGYRTLDGLPFPTTIQSKKKDRMAPIPLATALARVKASKRAKFDETVELALTLGIDPRRGDQMVRGVTQLPHGTGRSVRVAVFASGEDAIAAREAGAEVVGAEDLIASIAGGGGLDFDKAVATPSMMPKVGRVARILGPRGLMPNPKLGTVTANVGEAVAALKRGKVEFRADKGGVVHAGLGKVSFTDAALAGNVASFMAAILAARPRGLKGGAGAYVRAAMLSSTMGPGIPVSLASLTQAAAAAQVNA